MPWQPHIIATKNRLTITKILSLASPVVGFASCWGLIVVSSDVSIMLCSGGGVVEVASSSTLLLPWSV